ncbi:AtzE family amidohydrolase [Sphingomonas canadensis]|uniref:AtzE family amidohydrolase n=1 Tax=Sphingomonas canadensis TaxID=1219257 RepID=A0ABW3H8V5_9SPHN|nr:AtzE family amidohydrolase [Sphingomonas canadensis]MCW3837396.1 AtzE family amidohydrolase [Sphingomonas canadensis]
MSGALAAIAADVRGGRRSALALAEEAIARIRTRDGAVNAVTRLLADDARAAAAAIDARVAAGEDPGPLAGVPFGVKDLFDVAGLPTTAGAGMRREAAPAAADAVAVARLKAAGAVLVATCNMDEYAYGFATVNAAFGTTRNPHDPERLAGGSSGGSAAAVAAGMLPLTLGSDTNGSIRIPAALCGLYGLKPTHGSLPMAGVFPFVDSFDDIGPFAASAADLKLAWQVLGGSSGGAAAGGLKVARLGGWFARNADAELIAGIDAIAAHLGGIETVALPEVGRARSAAFLMTAAEGGALHLPELRARAMEYDPATRDRLIAGAMLPASAYFAAERFRGWFRAQAAALFARCDVLIAPAAGTVAPRIDDPAIMVDGQRVPARANLGIFTQPLSFIGLPVVTVPLKRPGMLPLGLQLVGPPGGEPALFALAEALEAAGLTGTDLPG